MILNDYINDDNYLIGDDTEEDQTDSTDSGESSAEETPVEESVEVTSQEASTEEVVKSVTEEESHVKEAPAATSEEAPVEEAVVEEDQIEIEEDKSKRIPFPYLIGKKIGMTQLFSDEGQSFPVTVLEAGPCSIIQIKSDKYEGYSAVQLGYEDLKKNKINKSVKGHFDNSNVIPKRYLKEFITSNNKEYKLGDIITINQFSIGDFIRITGTSKGKGFTGHMKRHGFSGGRRSHGKNSVMRKAGSVGAGSDPSRVFPGMKMAGRKGNYNITIKNLLVVKVDQDKNLMFVNGSVPGAKNSVVYLSKI